MSCSHISLVAYSFQIQDSHLPTSLWAYFSPDLFRFFLFGPAKASGRAEHPFVVLLFLPLRCRRRYRPMPYGTASVSIPVRTGRKWTSTLNRSIGRVIFFVVVIHSFFFGMRWKERILNAIFYRRTILCVLPCKRVTKREPLFNPQSAVTTGSTVSVITMSRSVMQERKWGEIR